MAGLAGLLHQSGCRVTGSDGPLYPPTSTLLEDWKLEVYEGYDAAHLDPAPDLVVVGNAVRRGNPEAEAVLDRRQPHTSMPRLISERFLADRHSIVVSGTHGKTTTASMLAWVLQSAGRDPGFLIGGMPLDLEGPCRLGSGPAFVIEGDEYDTAFFDKGPKFMHYRPDTLLVGTVEFDHADIFRDLEQIKTTFKRLTNIVPGRGRILRHEDREITREVTDAAFCPIEGYGLERGHWRAVDLEMRDERQAFRVLRGGEPFCEIEMDSAGQHNVQNALAVIGAASEQGLTPVEIARGLATFRGVARRLQLRGEQGGVRVIDDFAHHPTAVELTLGAARKRYPEGRLWAVLEPRSWSMRRNVFQERLRNAFGAADQVVIAAVHGSDQIPADERLDPEALVAALSGDGKDAAFLAGVDAIVDHLSAGVRPGDTVVVMSNGGFGGIHERLLESFAAQSAQAGNGA
ncbi:hypothetical protein ABI59_23740 [Acidobacteria bacterium Mor1]|nr:hypothetical protein ABI59_23740 [Acidobacteria bacterium Mor1]